MKRTPPYLLAMLAILLFTSCEKELSLEQQTPPVVQEEDTNYIIEGNYQLKDFYSDIPIDYIDNDSVVKSETQLWEYVSEYLKDDINDFSKDSGVVVIHQNALKIEGLDDEVLTFKYSVGEDDKGRYMKFLDNKYKPLKYRLFKIAKDYFILALPWKNGSTLFSRFERK